MTDKSNEITIKIDIAEADMASVLKHVEAIIIGEVFERTYNKSETATLLNLSRTKVQRVLQEAFGGKYRKIKTKK